MNKLHSAGFTAAACLLITFGGAPSVFANCCLHYHYQTITFSVPGATQTVPKSINSSGTVAGVYYAPPNPGGVFFGFIRDPDGAITTFNPGTLLYGSLVYINDSGVVAGTYYDGNSVGHGFVGNPKVANGIVSFDPPGSVTTIVTGINGSGWVTGYFSDGSHHHGFIYVSGTSYTIDYPGATDTYAESITSQGVVVGVYDNLTHGFWCFFGCVSFNLPLGYQGRIYSANSSLVVEGSQLDGKLGTFVGYVGDLLHGISSVFQYPGSSSTEAFGINSSGEVIGYYHDNVGLHAFLRDPNGLIVNVDPPAYSGFAIAYAINDSGAFTGFLYPLGFITIPEAPPSCCIVAAP